MKPDSLATISLATPVTTDGLAMVDRLLAAWCAGKSRHTRRARLDDLEIFGRHAFGVEDVRVAVYRFLASGPLAALELALAWDAEMAEQGHTPRSRARRLSTLRTLVAAAGPFGCPWSLKVRGPRVKKIGLKRGPPIERVREAIARLEHEKRWRDLALVLLCFDLSMRTEEAVRLRIESLDLLEETVTFVRKGGSRQTRTLTARLAMALRNNASGHAEGWVFPASRGPGHMDPRTANRLGHELGIGGLHGLRHTVASAALAAGVPSRAIQKQLGHEHLATTESYLDDMRDDEGAVARWLAGEGETTP